jgi:hypothetical protein
MRRRTTMRTTGRIIWLAGAWLVLAFRGYSTLGGIVGDGQRRIQLVVRADF